MNLPVPDSSDFQYVAHVNFDEIENELKQVEKELKSVEGRVESVLKLELTTTAGGAALTGNSSSTGELNDAFKKKMTEFLKNSNEELKEQGENLLK